MYLNSDPLINEVALFISHEETSKIAILHSQYSLRCFFLSDNQQLHVRVPPRTSFYQVISSFCLLVYTGKYTLHHPTGLRMSVRMQPHLLYAIIPWRITQEQADSSTKDSLSVFFLLVYNKFHILSLAEKTKQDDNKYKL